MWKRVLCLILGHRFTEVQRLPPTYRAARVRCLRCQRQYAQMQDPTEWTCGHCVPWEQAKPFYTDLNR